jgi:hypothetical protein
MCDGPDTNYVPPTPRFVSPDFLRQRSRPQFTELINCLMTKAAGNGHVKVELPSNVVTDYYWFQTKEELERAGFTVFDELDGAIFYVSWAPKQ